MCEKKKKKKYWIKKNQYCLTHWTLDTMAEILESEFPNIFVLKDRLGVLIEIFLKFCSYGAKPLPEAMMTLSMHAYIRVKN